MTTINQATESIYKHLLDNWDETTYPVTLDGENFTEPTDQAWIRLSIRTLPGHQDTLGSIGNRVFQRQAHAIVQVFVPANGGRQLADTLAQSIRAIFEGISLDGMNLYQSDIREAGVDGLWYQVVVETFFTYNETK